MPFKIIVYKKLSVPVKGTFSDEDGKSVEFSFTLLCRRLNQLELDAVLVDSKTSVAAFIADVAMGWRDVLDCNGEPLEFNGESVASVLAQPGMASVCFELYLKEIGAVAKADGWRRGN